MTDFFLTRYPDDRLAISLTQEGRERLDYFRANPDEWRRIRDMLIDDPEITPGNRDVVASAKHMLEHAVDGAINTIGDRLSTSVTGKFLTTGYEVEVIPGQWSLRPSNRQLLYADGVRSHAAFLSLDRFDESRNLPMIHGPVGADGSYYMGGHPRGFKGDVQALAILRATIWSHLLPPERHADDTTETSEETTEITTSITNVFNFDGDADQLAEALRMVLEALRGSTRPAETNVDVTEAGWVIHPDGTHEPVMPGQTIPASWRFEPAITPLERLAQATAWVRSSEPEERCESAARDRTPAEVLDERLNDMDRRLAEMAMKALRAEMSIGTLYTNDLAINGRLPKRSRGSLAEPISTLPQPTRPNRPETSR